LQNLVDLLKLNDRAISTNIIVKLNFISINSKINHPKRDFRSSSKKIWRL